MDETARILDWLASWGDVTIGPQDPLNPRLSGYFATREDANGVTRVSGDTPFDALDNLRRALAGRI